MDQSAHVQASFKQRAGLNALMHLKTAQADSQFWINFKIKADIEKWAYRAIKYQLIWIKKVAELKTSCSFMKDSFKSTNTETWKHDGQWSEWEIKPAAVTHRLQLTRRWHTETLRLSCRISEDYFPAESFRDHVWIQKLEGIEQESNK